VSSTSVRNTRQEDQRGSMYCPYDIVPSNSTSKLAVSVCMLVMRLFYPEVQCVRFCPILHVISDI
jgi:hypothetical protein